MVSKDIWKGSGWIFSGGLLLYSIHLSLIPESPGAPRWVSRRCWSSWTWGAAVQRGGGWSPGPAAPSPPSWPAAPGSCSGHGQRSPVNGQNESTRLIVNKPVNFKLFFLVLGLFLIMFYLNMVDWPVFFPSLSTWTWDTFLTLRGTWGFYLNHVLPRKPWSYRVCGWVDPKFPFTLWESGIGLGLGLWLVNYTNVYSVQYFCILPLMV